MTTQETQAPVHTIFILLLASVGAGKTTTIEDSVEAMHERGLRVGVLYNDDGSGNPNNVDLDRSVRRFADVETLTAGCFGCADVDTFVERVQVFDGEVDIVFIEPMGFTSAAEMLNACAQASIRPHVVTLIDAANLDWNRNIGTMAGQIAAADVVLITKAPDEEIGDNPSPQLSAALQYVGECTFGVPIRLHKKGDPYEAGQTECDHCGGDHEHEHDHSHDHHHHHNHNHDHGHDHGGDHFHNITYSVTLRGDVTPPQLRQLLTHPGVYRVKARAGDLLLKCLHGEWEQRPAGPDLPNFVSFYAQTEAARDEVVGRLAPHVVERRDASLGTADEVRDHVVDDGGQFLLHLIEECEGGELTFDDSGHPITNTELQELLNEVRKRPGTPEDLQARAVRARVHHLLKCGDWYLERAEMVEGASWRALHGIAVGIGWFCSEQPERVGEELTARAIGMPIARWLAQALMRRDKTNSDARREHYMATEAGTTAIWARQHCPVGEDDPAQLAQAYAHNVRLAGEDGRDAVVGDWASVAPAFS